MADVPAATAQHTQTVSAEDVQRLADEHRCLVRALARFPLNRWNRAPPQAKKWTFGEMIVGILSHDVYHTGQIQLMKRLYRARR